MNLNKSRIIQLCSTLLLAVVVGVFGFSNRAMAADMVTFATTTNQVLSQGDNANIDVSIFQNDGVTPCSVPSTCTYTITSSPVETITSSISGNEITGHFTASRKGTYSLIVSVTDPDNNTQTNTLPYFVDSTTGTIRYYFRSANATHGQVSGPPYGTGTDNGPLLLTPPQATEERHCGLWVQFSPDQMPIGFPMTSLLSSFSGNFFVYNRYTNHNFSLSDTFGLEKNVTYDVNNDLSEPLTVTHTPTENNLTFSNINWAMNSSKSWYSLAVKYGSDIPFLQSTPTNPSYADFVYNYTSSPAVGMTNPNAQWKTNVKLLSATASTSDSGAYSIVLQNTGTTTDPALLIIPNNTRPFLDTLSNIDSTGTSTLRAMVASSSILQIDNIPMDVTLTSGSVGINIINWNPSSTDYKNWTEIGSTTGDTAVSHTITGLSVDTSYTIRINNVVVSTATSTLSGTLTFSYTNTASSPYNQIEVYPSSSSPTYSNHVKYWYSTGSTDWGNLDLWYTDITHTTGATSLPTSTDVTIILGSNSPTTDTGTWVQPLIINAQAMGVNFTGVNSVFVDIVGNATFAGSSYNQGTVTGDAAFNGSGQNQGIVTGNATFDNTSSNWGSILGAAKYTYAHDHTITIADGGQWGSGTANSTVGSDSAPITSWIFNDSSSNGGTVTGNATFNGLSYNGGTVTDSATFNGSSNNGGTVTGDATFNDSSYNISTVTGDATFNNSSYDLGTVTGNATFNDSGNNQGTVTGDAAFNDSSHNTDSSSNYYGIVTGNATFSGSSYNGGTVSSNATFSGSSYNGGTVTGSADFYYPANTISGTVIGTKTYHNYPTHSFFGSAGDGDWANPANWSDDTVPISSDDVYIFNNITQVSEGTASVKSATFNSNTRNRINLTVSFVATFNDASSNYYGTVTGNAIFNGGSNSYYGTVTGNATFNDSSSNSGTVTGNATFRGSSNNSLGTVTSNATFNDASSNYYGTVTGSATFNDSSSNSGTVTSSATFNGSSSNQGTVGGNADFYYPAGTGGVVTGTIIYHNYPNHLFLGSTGDGDWANPANWSDDTVPISSDDVYIFNNITQVSAGTASVNSATFNGSAQNQIDLTVSLVATFKDSSSNSGTITGKATFNDSSSNSGTVSSNAIFNGDSSQNMGGSIGGTIVRRYSSDITTNQDFINNGPWTVLADGSRVNVSGALYDDTTTFSFLNEGCFIGGPSPVCSNITTTTLTTSPASALTQTTATLNANISSTGGANASDWGFQWGTTTSYGNTASTTSSQGTGDFSQPISSLTCATTYHFKAFATNSAGTANGSDANFTTSACTVTPTPTPTPTPSNHTGSRVTYIPANLPPLVPGCPEGYICTPNPTVNASTSATVNKQLPQTTFTLDVIRSTLKRDLQIGNTGPDVKFLQQYLNSLGYIISTTGAGSPGKETNLFGGLTKKALAKFQKDHGIPSTGYFGPKTRGYVTK